MVGECQLCGNNAKLVRAHILPRAVYPKLSRGEPFQIYSTTSSKNIRSQTGVYDRQILCARCDNEIGKYDDYAAKLLLPPPTRRMLLREEGGFIAKGEQTRFAGYSISNPDAKKLQMFAASLVLRAGATKRDEVSVEVPQPFMARCKELLLTGDPAYYLGVAGRRLDAEKLSQFVARPVKFSGDHGDGFEFYFSGFIINVLEVQPPNESQIWLGNSSDWWIAYEPFWGSAYEQSLRKAFELRVA